MICLAAPSRWEPTAEHNAALLSGMSTGIPLMSYCSDEARPAPARRTTGVVGEVRAD